MTFRVLAAAAFSLALLGAKSCAFPILSESPTAIALSPEETVITLTVDPNGRPLSAFALSFAAPTSGLELVSFDTAFSPSFDPANGLVGVAGTFARDQVDPFVVGSVTLRGLAPGTQLSLQAGSGYSDAGFHDISAGGPFAVATVVQ